MIGKIFNIKKEKRLLFKNEILTEEDFISERRKASLPIFISLCKYFLRLKSKKNYSTYTDNLKNGIEYFLSHYSNAMTYLRYSYLIPSDNEVEANIRDITITKKVSLFLGG